MSVNPIASYAGARAEPIFRPEEALCLDLAFAPNLNIRRGGLLGQVSSVNQAEVQTINYTGTWATSDWIKLSIVGIDGGTYTSAALVFAANALANAVVDAAVESLLRAAGYHGATVTIGGGAGPTDQTVTFNGTALYKDMPLMTITYDTAGDGTVVLEGTTSGVTKGIWLAYDDDGTDDGRRVARAIAIHDFRTDYWGRVIFAKQADPSYGTVVGGQAAPQNDAYLQAAPAWFGGYFKVADLYIWNGATSAWDQYPDAAAVADLGRVICGAYNDSTGILSVS